MAGKFRTQMEISNKGSARHSGNPETLWDYPESIFVCHRDPSFERSDPASREND